MQACLQCCLASGHFQIVQQFYVFGSFLEEKRHSSHEIGVVDLATQALFLLWMVKTIVNNVDFATWLEISFTR